MIYLLFIILNLLPSTCSFPLFLSQSSFRRSLDALKLQRLPQNITNVAIIPAASYQRAEDWDKTAEAQVSLSWEERVKFESGVAGDGYQQNSILKNAIKTDKS